MGGSNSKEEKEVKTDDEDAKSTSSDDDAKEHKKPALEEKKEEEKETSSPNVALMHACKKGDVEAIRRCKAEGADINYRDDGPAILPDMEASQQHIGTAVSGDTPLHVAAEAGQTQALELLFFLDANLEATNKVGSTPLHRAVSAEKIEVVKMLLRKGANIHAKNKIGNTSLHLAAYVGNLEIAKELLRWGAYIHIHTKNKVEMTPLDYARKLSMQELFLNFRPEQAMSQRSLKATMNQDPKPEPSISSALVIHH